LGDFGLVGGIGGEEFTALDQVIDAGWNMVLVGPGAEEERMVRSRLVLPREAREVPLYGPERRAAAGTSAKRSSIEAAPITPSMALRSAGVSGR
jgi:hypothetical protein